MRTSNHNGCWPMFVYVCLMASFLQAETPPSEKQLAFFETRIRPVLIEHCYECHSEQSKQLKAGLRLDFREWVLRGGDSGPAIVPKQPDQSLLIEAVRYESLEMPPKGKLPEGVIRDLVDWVEMGAPDPRSGGTPRPQLPKTDDGQSHWAFQPIRNPALPEVVDRSWPLMESDLFILSRLEQQGLHPAPDADRYAWLRRVSFDLTGLPPTLEQIRQFAADDSPAAHAAVVDRLLASRAFGERWARHWLDLVGYADQIGTSNNVFAEHAWRYRDYVIDAFNDDKPFDRFIREQLAGDLLQHETAEEQAASLTATGFLVLGDLEIVEADKAKLHVDIVDQQVVKTSTAFLGMTVGCARCHDHKFDPIRQRDYYAIAGFFDNTQSVYKTHRGVWSDVLQRQLPETKSQQAARAERERRHAEKIDDWKNQKSQAAQRIAELDEQIERGDAAESTTTSADRKKERDQLARRIAHLDRTTEHGEFFAPGVPQVYAVRDVDHPRNMQITIRGNPRALGDAVPRGFIQFLSPAAPVIPGSESGRRELAEWFASGDNPLSARVTVNRIWQKLFGVGLAPSVDYFGVRAESPSHPELLDHLARRLIGAGWSQKQLIRSIVLSRAYRMASTHNEQAHAVDVGNRLLWRMSRRRLDAEAIRDALLAVSGQLHRSTGGPALPLEFLENVGNISPKNVNPPSFSLGKWRPQQAFQRTIYLPVIRSGAQPGPAELRNVFDFLQPAAFAGQRPTTAVPTQALFLMNSPIVKQHAAELSQRIEKDAADLNTRLDLLWLRALNRPIMAGEQREALAFLATAGEAGWVELCHAVLASNEFLMTL